MLYVITTLQLLGTNTKTSKETIAIIAVGHCDGLDQGLTLGKEKSSNYRSILETEDRLG